MNYSSNCGEFTCNAGADINGAYWGIGNTYVE